jgi:hypothetical protein
MRHPRRRHHLVPTVALMPTTQATMVLTPGDGVHGTEVGGIPVGAGVTADGDIQVGAPADGDIQVGPPADGDIQVGPPADGAITAGGGDNTVSLAAKNATHRRRRGVKDAPGATKVNGLYRRGAQRDPLAPEVQNSRERLKRASKKLGAGDPRIAASPPR